jgi:hypothetical protein
VNRTISNSCGLPERCPVQGRVRRQLQRVVSGGVAIAGQSRGRRRSFRGEVPGRGVLLVDSFATDRNSRFQQLLLLPYVSSVWVCVRSPTRVGGSRRRRSHYVTSDCFWISLTGSREGLVECQFMWSGNRRAAVHWGGDRVPKVCFWSRFVDEIPLWLDFVEPVIHRKSTRKKANEKLKFLWSDCTINPSAV